MKYQIRFLTGELFNRVFALSMGNALSIGRSHNNIVRLMTPDVSGRHLVLRIEPSASAVKVVAEVLSSRKTRFEEQYVPMGTHLEMVAGQKITMGEYNTFILECLPDSPDESAITAESDNEPTIIGSGIKANPLEILGGEQFPDTPTLKNLRVDDSGLPGQPQVRQVTAVPEVTAATMQTFNAPAGNETTSTRTAAAVPLPGAPISAPEGTIATFTGNTAVQPPVSAPEGTIATFTGNTAVQPPVSAPEGTIATFTGNTAVQPPVSAPEGTIATFTGNTAAVPPVNQSVLQNSTAAAGNLITEAAEEDDGNSTLAQETQVATDVELDHIRQQQNREGQKKYWLYGILIAVVFGLIMFAYFYRQNAIEEMVLWPTTPDGRLDLALVGVDQDAYAVVYPPYPNATQSSKNGLVEVETRIGVLYDIPLCLTLEYGNDRKGLSMDRDTVLQNWMDARKRQDVNWNFTSAITPGFSHTKHGQGIVYSVCSFTRMKDGVPWTGYVSLSRNGERNYFLIAEVPQWAQSRAGFLLRHHTTDLFFFFRKISQIDQRWEGCAHYREKTSLREDLEQVRYLLNQNDVQYWDRIHYLLTGALIKSTRQNNTDEYQKALKYLKDFRQRQNTFYTNQKLAYQMASLARDEARKNAIQIQCESAFTKEFRNTDCRYNLIRRKNWK